MRMKAKILFMPLVFSAGAVVCPELSDSDLRKGYVPLDLYVQNHLMSKESCIDGMIHR